MLELKLKLLKELYCPFYQIDNPKHLEMFTFVTHTTHFNASKLFKQLCSPFKLQLQRSKESDN